MEDVTCSYPLPNALLDAARHGELVVFVGAGASMLCGSPNWQGFSNRVVDVLAKAGKLSFLEAEQLRNVGDPRRTLSIAIKLAGTADLEIDFEEILHPRKPERAGSELYELLARLRPVFVTTNYDKWLDEDVPETASGAGSPEESATANKPYKRPKYYLREDLTPDRLAERGAVIHLHGSYAFPKSMVVSLRDYIEHYADDRVKSFLQEMFRTYTVLFVGYGLAEMEVLEYIVRSNAAGVSETSQPRHFLLYAYRSTEAVQKAFIEQFFRDQCGIQVIPYCIDARGHDELLSVFQAWEPLLDIRDPTLLDLQNRIDTCVLEAGPRSREAALRLVNRYPELKAYFINSLRDKSWLTDLRSNGFFDPASSPAVTRVKQGDTEYLQAEIWPALKYLEQISATLSEDEACSVLDILEATTRDAEARQVDNWRTTWLMAGVMSKLPLTAINERHIRLAASWLESDVDRDMIVHELGLKLLPRLLESNAPEHWEFAEILTAALTQGTSGVTA